MKSPPHPGRGLRYDIEALGLSVAEAAQALGISRQQLNNVLTGKSAITPEMAVRLEQGVGGVARGWLALQAAYDLGQVKARQPAIRVDRITPKVAAE
jgi:addiction module HigA family antidote